MTDHNTIDHSVVGRDTETDNIDRYYNKVFYPNTTLCVHNSFAAAPYHACRVGNRCDSDGLAYSVYDAENAPQHQEHSQTIAPPMAAP